MFRLEPKFLKVKMKDLKHYIVVGFIMAIAIGFFVSAFFFTPIANVVLLDYLYPVFIIPLSVFFLKEKITRNETFALLLALLAVFIINPLSSGYMFGNMLAVLGAVFMAILMVYMRFEDRTHSIGSVFWFLLFATVFLSPAPIIFGLGNFLPKIHWIILLGVVSTGLAYIFINYALEKLNAERVAVIDLTLVPLFAIIMGTLFIKQIPSLNVIVAGVILIGSSLIIKKHKHHRILKKG
jgi:drug/metabolite transporter (DMT)-like permease